MMNRLIQLFKVMVILIVVNGQTHGQWIELNSGSTSWLRDAWFMDESMGIVVGYEGEILKTTDAGESWMQIESNTTENLHSVFFADQQTGYITGAQGTILKSVDSGDTWDVVRSGPGVLHESFFISPDTGYIAGEGGNVLKTTDGGQTWTMLFLGTFNGKVSVFFNNANVGYFAGIGTQDAIVKTTDGGESFEALHSNKTAEYISIFFTSLQTGFACGYASGGRIIFTDDGGENWETHATTDQELYSIDFADTDYGYCVGGFPDASIILSTIDGGETWVEETSPVSQPLFDVFMVSGTYAYAVGMNGTILRLGNTSAVSKHLPGVIEVYPNPASDVVVVHVPGNNIRAEYTIYKMNGTLVRSGAFENHDRLDLRDLPPGVYLLTRHSETSVQTTRLIKN